MGRSNWPPSIVPNEKDQTVYLVANDFGKPDRAWAEAEYERTDLEAVIQDPLKSRIAIVGRPRLLCCGISCVSGKQ